MSGNLEIIYKCYIHLLIYTFFADFAECTYKHVANLDDEMVTMEILDTAGQVKN